MRQAQLLTTKGEVRNWKGCEVTASRHDEGHSREAFGTIEAGASPVLALASSMWIKLMSFISLRLSLPCSWTYLL